MIFIFGIGANARATDIVMNLSDSPDPVISGANLTYNITVSNNGPGSVTNVTMTDTLPAGVTFISVTPSQGSCSGTSTITCNLGGLSTGGSATVALVVRPTSSGTLTNTASASATETDPNTGNNTDTEATTVTVGADLAVTNSASPNPITAGANLTYSVGVSNNGPFSATGVTVTDALPAGVTFVSASGTGWTCSHSAGVVTCTRSSAAVGSLPSITIVGRPTISGTITNSVSVSATQNDPDSSNNTVTQNTTVNAGADVSLTNTDSPDPVAQGSNVTYTITPSNAGPQDATSITVTDTLPSGMTFVSASGTGWTCSHSAGVVTCTRSGPMSVGAMPAITLIATATATGTLTNTASISASPTDPNTTNNSASQNTVVQASGADLSITNTDSPDPVAVGSNITYTITPRNNGPSNATSITVTDTLDASTTFVSASGTGWTCSHSSGVVTCTRSGPITGSPATNMSAITIVVTSNTAGSISNTASVSGAETDSNSANNSATATTNVQGANADLSITNTDSPDPVAQGSNVTYTITPRNNGLSSATSITVTDTLDASTTFVSASGTGWTCSHSAGVVTCTRPGPAGVANMPVITVVAATTTAGTISNNACVSAATPGDSNSGNNCAAATTTVTSNRADLTVNATDSPDPVLVNGILTYTLTVTNNGPDGASNITLTDALASATFISATPSQGSCSGTATVTCNLGSLASGSSATVTIQIRPTATGTRANTASVVSSSEGDPDTTNNSVTIQTTVNTSADMSVSVTDSPDPVLSGTNLTYVITARNNGPANATGMTVTDTLPAGVTFVSATPSQGSCSHSSGVVTCNIGALASGTQQTVTVVVMPTSAGSITNNVSASATQPDPDTANNSAAATTTVSAPQVDLLVNESDSPDPVAFGSNVTYTVVVRNNGPSLATGVVLTDTPPAAFTLVSVTPNQGSCSGTSSITCNIGSLANGASATVTIVMTASTVGSHSNVASVTGNETDTDSSNNSVSETTTSRLGADLSITKTDSPDPATVNGSLTYTIVVTNNGPAASPVTTMTDTLPAGVTFVSATPSQGSCSGTAIVTCSLGSMASGGSATITVVVTPTAAGTLNNTATITGSEPDPDSSNNSASQSTIVNAPPSVTLFKSVTPNGTQIPGTDLAYNIAFSNTGGSPAANLIINDSIPANTDFKLASVTNNLGTTGVTVTVAYSNDNGATYTYTPTGGAGGAPAGYDRTVTHVRWIFGAALSQTAPNNAGDLTFVVRIR